MAKKQLNDLAKIGLGLAAAYGASKILGQKDPMEIAKLEGSEASLNQMEGPAKLEIPSMKKATEKQVMDQAKASDAATIFSDKQPSTLNPKTGMYGEPGSIEGFRASEEARKARIASGAWDMSPDSPKAKLAARIGRAKGGEVLARGNKIARSKPTKLY